MDKVSRHFNRSEFACSCGCGLDPVDVKLLEMAEKVREHFGRPIKVHCACRCLKHNREIGSKDSSQHPKCKAIDFHVKGVEHQEVYDYIHKYIEVCGLGIYNWGIHLDCRGSIARWDRRDTNE